MDNGEQKATAKARTVGESTKSENTGSKSFGHPRVRLWAGEGHANRISATS